MSMLAEMTWGQWALASFLVFVCFILMLVILLQKGRGGGFAGAFGGAGGSSAFGAKTGDVFTWITVVVAGVFVLLTIWGNFVFDESLRPSEAVAAPTTTTIPVEGLEGIQPGQPVKMELGIVDPKTGEKSAILVPATPTSEGAPPAEGEAAKAAQGDLPPASADDKAAAPSQEQPPEGEKKEESENRPTP